MKDVLLLSSRKNKTKQKKKHEKKDQLPAGEEDEKNSDAETAR